MISDIEFLEAVCERMQQVGLVQSKAGFSARILGKGPSYLTSMSARDRKVPDEVMTHLVEWLQSSTLEDEAALVRLADMAARREHDRKHRVDMLEWIARHRAVEAAPEPPRQQVRYAPSIFAKIICWWSRSYAVTNRGSSVELQ